MNKYNRSIIIGFSLLVLSGGVFADNTTTRTITQDFEPQYFEKGGTYTLDASSGTGNNVADVTFSINGSAFSPNAEQSGLTMDSRLKYQSIESTDEGAGGMGSVKVTYQSPDGSPPQKVCIIYYSTSSNQGLQGSVTYYNYSDASKTVHCSFSNVGPYNASDTYSCNKQNCDAPILHVFKKTY